MACVLSYHNMQPENTFTFFCSGIIWPKVYLISLFLQKINSVVKGWVWCVFETSRFPFTTQPHWLKQPCLLPDAWSHRFAAAQRHQGWPGLDFWTSPSLGSALATSPLLLQEILWSMCKMEKHAKRWSQHGMRRRKHSTETWTLYKGGLWSWFMAENPSWCKYIIKHMP